MKNEIQTIKSWMDEPIPVHDFLPEDFEYVVLDSGTTIEVAVDNVTYVYTEADARPVYEEDFGEVDPSHLEVYHGGMDWSGDGTYLCLTGDVDGVPCEAYWGLDRIEIDANFD